MVTRLDAFAFSSLWAACAAAALTSAAASALGLPLSPGPLALAFAGTLMVYNVDRLRDMELDRATAPLRTAFVSRHRSSLSILAVLAGATATLLAWHLGPAVVLLCGVCVIPGLFHRRFKKHLGMKTFYVTAVWGAVTIGLPVLANPVGFGAEESGRLPWIIGIYAATLAANLIASNVRDVEHSRRTRSSRQALLIARGLTLTGVSLAWIAGPNLFALVWIPLTQAAALAAFRASERYGLWIIDGSLVLGSLLALGFSR